MAVKKTTAVPSDYGLRIKGLRERHALTQTRLAELLGVSFASVNRWENAQRKPSPVAWQQILRLERHGTKAFSDDHSGAISAKETPVPYGSHPVVPAVDFCGSPDKLWVVAEGERLTHGHLFNPSFATETSLIDPLPHQRLAVYEHMLPQPRLRFLLADDAGAGKTIMSGLYIREMLSRRLIRRVLVVPPAGLLGNWERELRTLFGLTFNIVRGADAKSANPFIGPGSDRVIVSVDTLAGDRVFGRLQDPAVVPYDLVIFDECHKLAARQEPDFRIRKTDRYRLAEALAGVEPVGPRWKLGWHPTHLVLLTATPHMGKDFPYYCLWKLLEPDMLPTEDAFEAYPEEERRRHFIRRTKEEMVGLDGKPIYPTRNSDTLSYDLKDGPVSELRLYEEVTSYIRSYYNKARILNRAAARFAMGVFQRRLASSTYAILRSLRRREEKLAALIDDIRSGKLTEEQLRKLQQGLDDEDYDDYDARTADEEEPQDAQDPREAAQDRALGAVLALNLAQLVVERDQVQGLAELARQVYDKGEESKFDTLKGVLEDPRYKNEKVLIFTEHRDTLTYLVSRLEGIGYTGQIAHIHGGMEFPERDEQKEFFRREAKDGGARFLVATDAAGEGINLQFAWIMVNFDIPWNPARLEQRMGRIHRYGQKHDPVIIVNLIAGKTREGRVMLTLLTKLEKIRERLGSDKVFDSIGRLYEGVSMREYMARALDDPEAVEAEISGYLTEEQVKALEAREKRLYGDGGDVKKALPSVREEIEREDLRRLLPGYIRRYVERAAPLLGLGLDGDPNTCFAIRSVKSDALAPLWPALEAYTAEQQANLTFYKPAPEDAPTRLWVHPGDPFFDAFSDYACDRFRTDALQGAVFIDPTADASYLFHLALLSVVREADPAFPALAQREVLEYRLAGVRQSEEGQAVEWPVEHLLLLKGGRGIPHATALLAAKAPLRVAEAERFLREYVALPASERRRERLRADLDARSEFVRKGFSYQESDLAMQRSALAKRVQGGDNFAKARLDEVKAQQKLTASRKEDAIAILKREPELVAAGEPVFVAHALVVPTTDPEERKRYDAAVEAVAVQIAQAYEETLGATVMDVSTPERARAAGLDDWCGFDLLSRRPEGKQIAIEVKGRVRTGEVELSENEWSKACNLRDRYWLYVVYDCGTAYPRLVRVRDPFMRLVAKAHGGVIINASEVYQAAEPEGAP